MNEQQLITKISQLRELLLKLETVEMGKILDKRLRADMGDDFRENEGAKMIMEDHEMLHMRISNLKKELMDLKKRLIVLRSKF